jgi:hypothetical protein
MLATSRESPELLAYAERYRARMGAAMRADVPSEFLQRTDGSLARQGPGRPASAARSKSGATVGSQGPQPWTRGVDASMSVQIVPIAWIAGRVGRIGREWTLSNCCHCATARSVSAQPCSGRSRAACGGYVVIPWGGGGVSVISLARSGVQRSGGQEVAKMHAIRPSGRAALGASKPAQPSRQSASPTSW